MCILLVYDDYFRHIRGFVSKFGRNTIAFTFSMIKIGPGYYNSAEE